MRTRLIGTALAVTALLASTAQAELAVDLPDLAVTAEIDPLLTDARKIAETTGLPLALVEQQVRLQGAVGHLQEEVAQRWPDTFGGLWIDNRTGLVSIAFTQDAAANVASLAGSFVRPDLLVPVSVARSYRELKDTQWRMLQDRIAVVTGERSFPGLAVPNYALDVDQRANRLLVVTDGHTDETVAAFRAAYGDHVDLRATGTGTAAGEHACTKTDCRFYLRSGLGTGSGGAPNCTLAFTVRSSAVNLESTSAGHCTSGVGWHGGNSHGGTGTAINNGPVDARRFTLSSNFKAGPWIHVSNSEPARKVTSMQTYASLAVGQWICKSGITTNHTCGSVLSRDFTTPQIWNVPNHWNYMKTDMCDKPGDSGAGIFIGGQAVGIISMGNNGNCTYPYEGWHGHIQNAVNALGVSVVTSEPAPVFMSVSASGTLGTTGTITATFNKPVSCFTVNHVDWKVMVQGAVEYLVTSTGCSTDSSQVVTLTTNRPLIKGTSVAVTLLANTIQNPGGQNVAGATKTTTVP